MPTVPAPTLDQVVAAFTTADGPLTMKALGIALGCFANGSWAQCPNPRRKGVWTITSWYVVNEHLLELRRTGRACKLRHDGARAEASYTLLDHPDDKARVQAEALGAYIEQRAARLTDQQARRDLLLKVLARLREQSSFAPVSSPPTT